MVHRIFRIIVDGMEASMNSSLSPQHVTSGHPYILALGLLLIYLCYNKYRSGLSSIPGPTLAAYTKLWRLHNVWKGSAHLDAIALHKKHGNLVRIAPNHVSVADPKWIPVFYGSKEDYTKVGVWSRVFIMT